MFVRFRNSRARLQVSIVEPRRAAGKVRAEHVAGLGAIAQPATVIDRVQLWQSLHQRLAALANRIPDPSPILAAVHERIPLSTPDEQRAAMLEAAEADARLWETLRDPHQSTADDHEPLPAMPSARRQQRGGRPKAPRLMPSGGRSSGTIEARRAGQWRAAAAG